MKLYIIYGNERNWGDKMIRVLQVIGGMNAGGMETMLMNYYRNINNNEIQFDF